MNAVSFDRARRPQLPAELLRSVPREVTLTAVGKITIALAMVLLMAAPMAGALMYVLATTQAEWWRQAESEAVTARAEVIALGRTHDDAPRRVVTYRYAAGGQMRQGRTVLHRGDRRPLEVGSSLLVRYGPSTPGVSWQPGYEPERLPVILVPLAPAALALAGFAIVFAARRQRRFLAEGRAAIARVTRHERVHQGSHTAQRVHYQFAVPSGAMREGHYDVAKGGPAEGETLVVLYDSEQPRRQARYPLSLVRLARR